MGKDRKDLIISLGLVSLVGAAMAFVIIRHDNEPDQDQPSLASISRNVESASPRLSEEALQVQMDANINKTLEFMRNYPNDLVKKEAAQLLQYKLEFDRGDRNHFTLANSYVPADISVSENGDLSIGLTTLFFTDAQFSLKTAVPYLFRAEYLLDESEIDRGRFNSDSQYRMDLYAQADKTTDEIFSSNNRSNPGSVV